MRSGFRRPPQILKQERFYAIAAQFRSAMAQQDYAQAARCCEQILSVMPDNLQVLSDYALCLMRMEKYEKAYQSYLRIYRSAQRSQASATWLDGLTEVCGWLNKADEVRRFGHESLTLSDQHFGQGASWPIPEGAPPPFDPRDPEKNIIAFSLYGRLPRYCETLIKNVAVARELFPYWTCRIYLDDSVPSHVWQRLRQQQVQLVDMSGEKTLFPTLWRFLVASDPQVTRFIIRDADSLLSEREQASVEAWIASPCYFHHMRDYFTHTELLLAGMWGGYTGIIPDIDALIRQFCVQYEGNARFTDQYFLRSVLWATVRNSILNHDELFNFHHAQPWPEHPPIRWQARAFHVGSNAGYSVFSGPSSAPEGGQQALELEIEGERCRYDAPVEAGVWRLSVPFFLAEGYNQGKVRVHLLR
ncbi:tetratricopeptide repeat protein [Enterobacteriaceae bacterium BIT-l23]|uniref:tetratricopeptide repeat protein n=1 Tax=Jejubacter sp. L23 TaxID=3092086 RepID=UPI00158563F2|nr:tetratricopeptide repeat protein [Enterobacteriaceae bacterium BIT-l23]